MKRTDLAYVAGIVDGEGSINISRDGKSRGRFMQVSVCNTNEWLVRWLQFSFGGSISFEKAGRNKLSRQDVWRWNISYVKAGAFLRLILPYLRIKRPQAELALLFQSKKVGTGPITAEHAAIEEAQRLVMSSYNKGQTTR